MRIILLLLAFVTWTGPSFGSQTLVGGVHVVTVSRGDTLARLGSRYGVDPRTIADDNGIPVDQPLAVGTSLTIDNRHIVPPSRAGLALGVNVPQRMVFVFSGAGAVGYPVAVGRSGWQTPLGDFSIVSKETNPTWDVPESIRAEARRAGRSLPLKVPPGPNNPLGAYWLGLSLGSVGIHGTNAPSSVYHAITHGCIRMHADDIAALFGQVTVGSTGEVRYQPVLLAVVDGGDVFLEVHRDVYGRGPRDATEFVQGLARALGVFDRIDWTAAADVLRRRDGVARSVTRR